METNFFAVVGSRDVGERVAVGRPATPDAVVRAAMHALVHGRFQVTPGLEAALPALNRLLPRRLLLHVIERLYRGVQGDPTEPAPRYASF